MCTPWTMTRFIRWRLRDWVSCFLACRFPLDNDLDTFRSQSPQKPARNMVLDMKDDGRGNRGNKKWLKGSNRYRKERVVKHGSPQQAKTSIVSVENKGTNGHSNNRSHFQDEEYIVFCFREDGAFDVIKDGKPGATECFESVMNTSPRPINRKLDYSEVAETVRQSSNNETSPSANGNDICPTNEKDIVPVKEGEEEESSIYLDSRTRNQLEEIDQNCVTVPTESIDSNQSDGSSGSFSFPVLHWELMGSPVHMPKSQGLHLRKHRVPCARFQCCRF